MNTTASHRWCASPASAIAMPHATTAQISAMPCFFTRATQPDETPAITDPIATALNSHPTPPWNSFAATAGNSARGNASAIAAMSTANDSSSTGVVARYRRPKITSDQPLVLDDTSPTGRIAGSRSAAQSATVNVSASTAYAQNTPDPAPISTPAASGPATVATFDIVKFSVFAWASSFAGTMRGMIADRVGIVTATAADWSAT